MFLDADLSEFEIVESGQGLGELGNVFSKIVREVKRVGKQIDKNVFQPVKKTVEEAAEDVWEEMERFGAKVEKEAIRPVVHEALPYLAVIPGPQQPFVMAAAAAREVYVQQQQHREVERMISDADKMIAEAGAAALQQDVIVPDILPNDQVNEPMYITEPVPTTPAEPVWKKHPLLTGAGLGTILFLIIREMQ